VEDRRDELDLLLVALGELLGAPVGVFGDAEALEPLAVSRSAALGFTPWSLAKKTSCSRTFILA
jgi:hypothetical protein